MTHYKNSLLNNSGEGHIDTGIKIIIGIVIGALILGGLYALFDTLVMPKINTKVQGWIDLDERRYSRYWEKRYRDTSFEHIRKGFQSCNY